MEVYVDWLNGEPETLSRRTRERQAEIGSPLLDGPNTLKQAKDRCLAAFNAARERWRGRLAAMTSYEVCEDGLLTELEQSGWDVSEVEEWSEAGIKEWLTLSAPSELTGEDVIVSIDVDRGFIRDYIVSSGGQVPQHRT